MIVADVYNSLGARSLYPPDVLYVVFVRLAVNNEIAFAAVYRSFLAMRL